MGLNHSVSHDNFICTTNVILWVMSEGSEPSSLYTMIYRWENKQTCKQLIDWKANYVNYPSQRYDIW